MKEFSPMRRRSLMFAIFVGVLALGGCVNVTIDPTKPIEVHAVVDVNVKAVDTKTTDVFGEAVEKPAVPAKPAKP